MFEFCQFQRRNKMGKTIEAVKDAVKDVTDVVKDAFKGVEADAVIASFQTLLNSQKHPAPRQFKRNVDPVLDMGAVSDRTVSILKGSPSEFMFFGPADDLLRRMVAASGPEGLPKTGDQLVAWLKVHYYRHPNKK